jgi:hypothetical protein
MRVKLIVGGVLFVAVLFAVYACFLDLPVIEQRAIERKVERTLRYKAMKDKIEAKEAAPTVD